MLDTLYWRASVEYSLSFIFWQRDMQSMNSDCKKLSNCEKLVVYSRWCMCRANLKVGLIPRVNLWNCIFLWKPNICLLWQSCDFVCGYCSSLSIRQFLHISLALLFFFYSSQCCLWSGPRCPLHGMQRVGGGVSEAEGTKMICAYHTYLSSYWQESACSFVGERTCIQRGEERSSERNSGRMVGGGDGEKKLMLARHPIWGRFW